MTKRKISSKKPAARKSGTFKKLAARAMKLVKGKKAAPAAKAKPPVKAAPAKAATPKHVAPAPKPAPKPVLRARPRPSAGEFISAGGRLLSEAEVRRMPESAYMNDTQLEFFRGRLLQMRSEVVDREVDVKGQNEQIESQFQDR